MSEPTFTLAELKEMKRQHRPKRQPEHNCRNVNVVQGTSPKRAEKWAMRTGEQARTHYDDPVPLKDQGAVAGIPPVRQGYNAVNREFQLGYFRANPP